MRAVQTFLDLAAGAGLSPAEALPLTQRQLVRAYDLRQLTAWDHTATLAGQLHHVAMITNNLWNKTKIPAVPMARFNPLRADTGAGERQITAQNFGSLKALVLARGGR